MRKRMSLKSASRSSYGCFQGSHMQAAIRAANRTWGSTCAPSKPNLEQQKHKQASGSTASMHLNLTPYWQCQRW